MAGIVTFLLTVVYAQSALLRLREYYNNKGKLLPEQVIIEPAPIWCIFMGLSANFWCSIRKKGCVTLSQDCLTSLAGEYLKLQKVVLRFLLRFTNFCWLSLRVCHQKYSPFHKILWRNLFLQTLKPKNLFWKVSTMATPSLLPCLRLVPLLVVLPVTEALVGLESTDKGCW